MKKNINKKMIAFVIILIMTAFIIGIETMSIVGEYIVRTTLNNAPFEFTGIYGGMPAKVNDLIRHIPEYEWLRVYSDMSELSLISIPILLFFFFTGTLLVDWAEKED